MCTALAGAEAALDRASRSGQVRRINSPDKHVHRLVLAVVILQAQHVAGLDVQDLADVAIGAGPDQLVSPRLVHPVRHLGHWSPFVARARRKWWRNID